MGRIRRSGTMIICSISHKRRLCNASNGYKALHWGCVERNGDAVDDHGRLPRDGATEG